MPYKRKHEPSVMESTHSRSRSGRKSSRLATYTAPSSNGAGPPNCVFLMDRNIRGIAGVGDEIFMVHDNHSRISVYDSDSLGVASRHIAVPNMKSPWDLAGCSHNRALYISDWKPESIHRVDLTNNSITGWNLSKNYESRRLSVTAEHTLLVTVQISDTRGGSRVVEYTSEGQLMREIELDERIKYAWQTLQLSSDRFVICHVGKSSLLRVSLINTEGQIIKSYGRKKALDEGQLGGSYAMTIDDKSKRIFIADGGKNRVLMLEADLTYTEIDQIYTPPRFCLPSCVYFDTTTQRLLVDSVEPPMSRSTLPVTQIMNHDGYVSGVTVVDGEIFVVGYDKSQVSVYDSHSLRASREIKIPGMEYARGLAGCSYKMALYIGDAGRLSCIHRVDLINNSIIRWKLREHHEPYGLSVTAEHILLVTVIISYTASESRVVEYTSEGKLVREISLDEDCWSAEQAIQLSGDQFIISAYVNSVYKVCVNDTEGQISKSFEEEGGEDNNQLHHSCYVAIDFDNNHVFLARGACNRVVKLDKDLNYLGETRMHSLVISYLYFDSSTHRLFVCESTGRLLISHPLS